MKVFVRWNLTRPRGGEIAKLPHQEVEVPCIHESNPRISANWNRALVLPLFQKGFYAV